MGNCLVTKLKGVVDNNNLLKIGELRFKLPAGMTNVSCKLGNNVKLSLISGTATIKVDGNTASFPVTQDDASTYTVSTTTECVFSINNKYLITNLCKALIISTSEIDTIEFIGSPIQFIDTTDQVPANNRLKGDIANIVKNPFGMAISLPRCRNITGYFYTLAKGLGSNVNTISIFDTKISGSIEDFVQAARNLPTPITSKTLNLPYLNGIVTWKGTPQSGESNVLTWDENSVTFNGDTL